MFDKDKDEEFSYICINKCTYGGKFYREDDILVLPEKKEVPHFKLAEKGK